MTPRRTYYVKADSAAEVSSWCRQIEAAKAEYAARTTRASLDTPTGTEHPTPESGTPLPSPRHAVSTVGAPSPLGAEGSLSFGTASGASQQQGSHHSHHLAGAYAQGIAIPGSSAPAIGGSFAPASYTTTASSSYGAGPGSGLGGAGAGASSSNPPTPAVLGSSYASTASSFGHGPTPSSLLSAPAANAGARAPPNSLVQPAPVGAYDQRTGLGLQSPNLEIPGGLDARLEQLDWADGAAGRDGPNGGAGTAPTMPNLQRASSRRSDYSAAGGAGTGRGRSASNATGISTGSSAQQHSQVPLHLAPPPASFGGAASSSDEEEAYEMVGADDHYFAGAAGAVPPVSPGVATLGGGGLATPIATPMYAGPVASPGAAGVSPAGSGSGAVSAAAAADPNRIILSGYLMKQGKRKTWRKRWFVLTSGMLMYSRSHMVRLRIS